MSSRKEKLVRLTSEEKALIKMLRASTDAGLCTADVASSLRNWIARQQTGASSVLSRAGIMLTMQMYTKRLS